MKIHRILTRNIGPFGDRDIDINLDNDPLLWLLMGKNGKGKSTLIKIIKMGLYHEYDVPVKEISNEINGEGYICIWFTSKNQNWVIETGFKPNYIKLYMGMELTEENFLDKGKLPETKEYIKNQVLDYPYYIFNNVISLNIDDFKSFLKMNAKDARNIRDRIFGFYVINEMVEIHKSSVKDQLDKYDSIQNLLEAAKQSFTDTQFELDAVKTKIAEGNQREIAELKISQGKINEEVESLDEQLQNIDLTLASYEMQINLIDLMNAKSIIEQLNNQIAIKSDEIESIKNMAGKEETALRELERKRGLIDYLVLLEKIEDQKKQLIQKKSELTSIKGLYDKKAGEFKQLKADIDKKVLDNEKRSVIQAKIDIAEEYIKLDGLAKACKKQVDDLKPLIDENESTIQKIIEKEISTKQEIKNYSDKIEVFHKGLCDTCGSDLTTDHNTDRLSQMEDSKSELETNLTQLDTTKETMLKSKISMKESFDKANNDWVSHKSRLESLLRQFPDEPINDNTLSKLKNSLNDHEHHEVGDLKTQLVEIKQQANDLKSKGESMSGEYKALNQSLKDSMSDMESLIKKIGKDNLDQTADINAAQLNELISNANSKIRQYQQSLNDLKSDVETTKIKIKSNEDKINILDTDKLSNITRTFDDKESVDEAINESRLEKNGVSQLINDKKTRKHDIEYKINSLSKDDNIKSQLEGFNNMLNKLQIQIDGYTEELNELSRDADYNKLVLDILSDSGIKSHILSNIVPYINYEIADNLELLDVPLNVVFDDEFKAHIYRRGAEVSLASISTGQKKKINFSILMAITLVLINRYGNINVIFYDEIFSSVDEESRLVILNKIRRYLVEKLGIHVILVNHFYFPSSYFDKYLLIETEGEFSTMSQKEPDEMIDYVAGNNVVPVELEKADI